MKSYFDHLLKLTRSRTAIHLYWVFSGNALTIVLTFFTTILIANNITKAENGIFLALFTFANLLSDLGELGLGSALSNFVPKLLGHKSQARQFVATAFTFEIIIAVILGGIILLLAPWLSSVLFAHTSFANVALTALLTMVLVIFGFSIFALSAYQLFREVSVVNMCYSVVRLGLLLIMIALTKLSVTVVLFVYSVTFMLGWLYSLIFLKDSYYLTIGTADIRKKFLEFSSLLGLQKVFISISSRLDVLMLIPLLPFTLGPVEAGIYGIASRFALVYPLIISSLGQVLAPKFAQYKSAAHAGDFFKSVLYIIGLLVLSQIAFYILAQPIISILVPKYMEAVPVLQGLLIAMTGFIIATPFVSFIIYTMNKPVITTFSSLVQLIIIFLSNLYFVPHFGRFGPVIGIGLGNLAICIISIGATVYYFNHHENRH